MWGMSNKETETFNRFCAEISGIELYTYQLATEDFNRFYIEGGSVVFDPYDDINQLSDTIDYIRKKYLWSCQKAGEVDEFIETVNTQWFRVYSTTLTGTLLKDALRTFIWALMVKYASREINRLFAV